MHEIFQLERLVTDLRKIGVSEGDTVYVRAKVSAIGRMASRDILLLALLEAVGPQGNVVVPAFTGYGLRWRWPKKKFTSQTQPTSGALSKMVLDYPGAYRSTHPSHSFAAIGPSSRDLLIEHNESMTAFSPMKALIGCNAKMLLVGCNSESPGFSTVHYVQEQLGLSHLHFTKFFMEVTIGAGDHSKVWRPSEDPGCSVGFDKMYPYYIRAEKLHFGHIGNAATLLIGARDAYEIDHAVLTQNPRAVLCDNNRCVSCRGLRGYNLVAIPATLVRRLSGYFTKQWG